VLGPEPVTGLEYVVSQNPWVQESVCMWDGVGV
jgi:hypothetical protein